MRAKEKPTTTDRTLLVFNQNNLNKNVSAKFRYVRKFIEANPDNDMMLFALKDYLKDSVDIQKEVFNSMKIVNKASNIYMVLDSELNSTVDVPVADSTVVAE